MPLDTDKLDERQLLVRLNERQDAIRDAIRSLQAEVAAASERHASKRDMERLETDVKESLKKLADQIVKLENKYVTKDTFDPIKRIVYGAIGLILVAFMTAVITLVIIPMVTP